MLEIAITLIYIIAFCSSIIAFYKFRLIQHLLASSYLLIVVLNDSKYFQLFSEYFEQATCRYNTLIILELFYYFSLFYFLLKSKRDRKIIMIVSTFFAIFTIIDISYLENPKSLYLSYSYLLGAVTTFILIMRYFYVLLVNLKPNEQFYRKYWFWISCGLLIFLSADIPSVLYYNYLINNNTNLFGLIFNDLRNYAICLYYLTYPIALIWATRSASL